MIVWHCEWADDLCDRGEFYVDHSCYRTREEAKARAREIEAAGEEEDEDCRTTVRVEWMRILYSTDRLRKALDEHGIEWHRNDFEDFTEWEAGDAVYTSIELDDGSLSIQTFRKMTVEEVMAETLANMEAEDERA